MNVCITFANYLTGIGDVKTVGADGGVSVVNDDGDKALGIISLGCSHRNQTKNLMSCVAPRPPVVSTDPLASSGSLSGSPPGESTVLRMRLYILLTCCVRGVYSHDEDMVLRMRAEDQSFNTTKYEGLY